MTLPLLSRMDRYVGAAVVEAYLATGAGFFVISILLDLLVNIGKYVRQAQDSLHYSSLGLAQLLCEYYACWLPVLFLLFAPYVTVIACMFGITKLTATNELVPMVFSGRSVFAVLRPALVVAALSGLAMAAVWQFGGSTIIERYQVLRDMLNDKEVDIASKNVLIVIEQNKQLLRCARYRPAAREMQGVTVIDRAHDNQVTRAELAHWDEMRRVWRVTGGTLTKSNRVLPVTELDLPGVDPDVVERIARGANPEYVQMLSFTDLAKLREMRPGRHDLTLAYHLHLATPLTCVILVMLTVALAVQFERGSRVGRVIAAFFICAGFLVFDLTCRNLGLRQFVHPAVAAWTPSIVFGALGVLSYTSIRT
jgi:lipopolysaccharide export LptBFGC system permease protein LptF